MSAQLYHTGVGSGGLRNHIRPCEGAIFSGNDVPGHVRKNSVMSCAKMAEQRQMLFGFWIRVGRMKWRRCGLMSNYSDDLLFYLSILWAGVQPTLDP